MKNKKLTFIHFLPMFIVAISISLSACNVPSPSTPLPIGNSSTAAPIPAETQTETPPAITYKEFTKPFVVPGYQAKLSFELPEEWEFWANAGCLSADKGITYGCVWVMGVKDSEIEGFLVSDESFIHEKANVMLGEREAHRYIVEQTLSDPSTKQVTYHTYEMIYILPGFYEGATTAVTFSAPALDDLPPLIPTAEHMAQSLKLVDNK